MTDFSRVDRAEVYRYMGIKNGMPEKEIVSITEEIIDELSNVVIYFNELFNQVGFDSNYFELIFKVLGVGYIVEFTADIAEDFGNSAIASKVILGGKIIICGMTLPIIKNLLSSLLLFLS